MKHAATKIISWEFSDQFENCVLAGFLQHLATWHLQNWQQAMCFTRHGHTFSLVLFKQLHVTENSLGSFVALTMRGFNCPPNFIFHISIFPYCLKYTWKYAGLSQAGISSCDKHCTLGHQSECICYLGKGIWLRIFGHLQSYRLLAHSIQMHEAIHHHLLWLSLMLLP